MIAPWDTLTRFCRGSGDAVIAAPYMKEDALSRLLEVLAPDAALVCVTRWKLNDLLFGASDVNCRTLVLQRGGSFLLHPRLHAKFYRFGSHVLVGSANLTSAGMGYRGPANLEVLCTPEPGFDAEAFERELILGSRPVSDGEFEDWSTLARLPRPDSASTTPPEPLTDWRPATRNPEHVWLAYRRSLERIPSSDERRLAEVDLVRLGLPQGLERAAFNIWVRGALRSSTAVSDVRDAADMAESDAWEHLASAWSVSKAEAARYRATIEYWTAAFLNG